MTKEVLNFEVAKSVTTEYQIKNTFGAYALCQALEASLPILPDNIKIDLDVIKSLNENPTYIGTADFRDYFATLEGTTVTITSQHFYLESVETKAG